MFFAFILILSKFIFLSFNNLIISINSFSFEKIKQFVLFVSSGMPFKFEECVTIIVPKDRPVIIRTLIPISISFGTNKILFFL